MVCFKDFRIETDFKEIPYKDIHLASMVIMVIMVIRVQHLRSRRINCIFFAILCAASVSLSRSAGQVVLVLNFSLHRASQRVDRELLRF
jgi:hypothetical protein